ncbi:MAG: cytochrome c biogenesis protein ResB [Chloroflexi bacterium]|nr:cytochrome c biogenesis protein ResB [Chloroflexota bacterium]
MNTQQDNDIQSANRFSRAIGWLWHLLGSVKLAFILILIIAAVSLIGAFLIQVPLETARDPQAYAAWVQNVATAKVGGSASLLYHLQLFNVSGSLWFLCPGVLLMLNILICSLNRWNSIQRALRGGAVKQQDSFFTGGSADARKEITSVPLSQTEAAQLLETALRRRHYRVRVEADSENTYIAADKNRYFRLGTFVSHLSLILFVLAFVFGGLMGWRNTDFEVNEGATADVGHDTNLSLRLDSFVAEYYADGVTPKDYRSQVTLYDNGQEVKEALVRVNYPLSYQGVSFYQSSFGATLIIQMQVSQIDTSTTLYEGGVTLKSMGSGYYVGNLDLPDQNYTVYVIGSTNAMDPMIPAESVYADVVGGDGSEVYDLVQKGIPISINGLEFTYSDDSTSQYSVFQVSRDPTNMLIWIASGLFILGISLFFYFPRRQVWGLSQRQGEGNSRLLIRTIAPHNFSNTSEIEALTKDFGKDSPVQRR